MRTRNALVLAAFLAMTASACRDDSPTGLAGTPRDGRVFIDNFISSDFQAFSGSKLDAVQLDTETKYRGAASLRVTVPAEGATGGSFAGGAFVASAPRDLSQYDALTFYARASAPASLNVGGLGNDNTGTSLYGAERNAIPLTTAWTKVIIPIPLAARLTAERGLFFFAEGFEAPAGYSFWLDDIQFETLGTITNPRPALTADTILTEVGATQQVSGLTVTFAVNGADQTVSAAPAYFTFTSSNTSVATVNAGGLASVLAAGTADITAALGSATATGALRLEALTPPSAAAPTPTRAAGDVESLFSNAYTNRTVDTWSAPWDNADVSDVTVGGNAVKRYSNFVFAGIEFTSNPVNATALNGFHMDVFVNDASNFRIKLVDFGADGAFGGGDDTEQELAFNTTSTPALVAGQWNSLDIPLWRFTNMTGRSAIAQMILVGTGSIAYVDNVYFFNDPSLPGPPAPASAAPTPSYAAGDVVSLFSDAYTNVTVDTWSAGWDAADVSDITVAGNATKSYTNLTFAGIEFVSNTVDASAMTHFRMDIWTPDAAAAPSAFKVKLVDFGADGTFGGGDDVEHELTFDATTTPALASGSWVSLDVPLTQFTGLTTRAHLAQMILVGDGAINTVFVDNVLFYRDAPPIPSVPTAAAPTPTYAAGDAISLFSNAYTNVTVDTWSASWDAADVADITVAGNDTKSYTNLTFAGIEFTSATINASAMTHFRMDIWTPDAAAAPSAFKVKLVDFGANGAFGGGDDVEHELTFNATTTPALVAGSWITLDIPLTQFAGLTTRAHLAQMILVGDGSINTVFVDNVLLHR